MYSFTDHNLDLTTSSQVKTNALNALKAALHVNMLHLSFTGLSTAQNCIRAMTAGLLWYD